MRDSETNEGTDVPCQHCGNLFYTMGDFATKCDDCGASIANTETGETYTSDGKAVLCCQFGEL